MKEALIIEKLDECTNNLKGFFHRNKSNGAKRKNLEHRKNLLVKWKLFTTLY